jgi:hypothetical protein
MGRLSPSKAAVKTLLSTVNEPHLERVDALADVVPARLREQLRRVFLRCAVSTRQPCFFTSISRPSTRAMAATRRPMVAFIGRFRCRS